MAVYYKFKSETNECFAPIPIEDPSISVANLKEKIIVARNLGNVTDFGLIFTDKQTKEDYIGEATLIPRNTYVLVRRAPGRPHVTVATKPEDRKKTVPDTVKNDESAKSTSTVAGASATFVPEVTHSEDELLKESYDIPAPTRADEDSKIKALNTPALDRQRQPQEGFYAGRGFGRAMGGKTIGRGRGFGRGGFEREPVPPDYTCYRCGWPGHLIQHCPTNGDSDYDHSPPKGYICRRCNESGHFIQRCPTNRDPNFDIKKAKPNEAALKKEMERLPSTTRSTGDFSGLRCPLCKKVMKDAVLNSKCCFESFCDKCNNSGIKDYIITKSKCFCGATDIISKDLVPNYTLRDTVNSMLESNKSSAAIAGRETHIQVSAASRGELGPAPHKDGNPGIEETRNKAKNDSIAPQQLIDVGMSTNVADASETTRASMGVKELGTQGKSQMAEAKMQQKVFAHEPDTHWNTTHDPAAGNYMMMPYPSTYNPYQGGRQQPGMYGYINPNASTIPYTAYPPGLPHGSHGRMNMIPQDPFGQRGYELPGVPPQRDLSMFAKGSNQAPPIMSREESEARQADLTRYHEMERNAFAREIFEDRNIGGEMSSSAGVSSMISRSRPMLQPPPSFMDHSYHHQHQQPPPSFMDHSYHHQHQRPEWPWNPERSQSSSRPIQLGKRKASQGEELYEADQVAAAADIRNNRGNVFPRSSAYPHNHHLSSSTGYNYHNEPPEAPSFAGASHHHRHHHYRLLSSATGHHDGRRNEANASTQPSYGRSTRNQSNMPPDDRKWRDAAK